MSNENENVNYKLWGSKELISNSQNLNSKRIIQEVMHDLAPKHNFKKQYELHEKIKNDEDYDDWEYGTEPQYGSSWKSS